MMWKGRNRTIQNIQDFPIFFKAAVFFLNVEFGIVKEEEK